MNGGWNGFKVRGFETLFKDPPSLTLLEAFEEPTGPSFDSDTLEHFSAPKNDDVKPFEIQKHLDTSAKDKTKKVSGKFRQQCDICLFAFDSKDSFETDQEKHKQQLIESDGKNKEGIKHFYRCR